MNVLGTFHYLIAVLDGYSRFILNLEWRESMTADDVEIALQRAIEKAGRAGERLISDNGRQFIAKDFRNLLRLKGMKQVRAGPFDPQSNGKLERAHKPLNRRQFAKLVVLSYKDAVKNLDTYIAHYNNHRLPAALQYVTPRDMLEGTAQQVWDRRDKMLAEARRCRRTILRNPPDK